MPHVDKKACNERGNSQQQEEEGVIWPEEAAKCARKLATIGLFRDDNTVLLCTEGGIKIDGNRIQKVKNTGGNALTCQWC